MRATAARAREGAGVLTVTFLMLAALAATGLGGPGASGATKGPGPAGADCELHAATVPLPAFVLGGLVPQGFRLVTLDDAGLVGLAYVRALACEASEEGGMPWVELWRTVLVEPPAHLAEPGVAQHAVPIRGYLEPGQARDWYEAHGFAHHIGETLDLDLVTLDMGPAGDPARVGEATLVLPTELFRLHTATAGAGLEEAQEPAVWRLWAVQGGQATASVDLRLGARTSGGGLPATFTHGPLGVPLQGYPGVGDQAWGFAAALQP